MFRDNSFPALLLATLAPPCATESGTPGSQNSSSTCTGGGRCYFHNQVPVLFWKDCSCRLYLKRRSFEREFFVWLSQKIRSFQKRWTLQSVSFYPALAASSLRGKARQEAHAFPVLLTQVTASSLFKWSGTKETAAQRAKGAGHQGSVQLPNHGEAAWGSPPPFSASHSCAHPPKVSRKRPQKRCHCEMRNVLDLLFPPRALGCLPPPRWQFTQARKWFLPSI